MKFLMKLQSQDETLHKPKLGIMLEVPSVLYQLPQLAKHVDFFSVGSNDFNSVSIRGG